MMTTPASCPKQRWSHSISIQIRTLRREIRGVLTPRAFANERGGASAPVHSGLVMTKHRSWFGHSTSCVGVTGFFATKHSKKHQNGHVPGVNSQWPFAISPATDPDPGTGSRRNFTDLRPASHAPSTASLPPGWLYQAPAAMGGRAEYVGVHGGHQERPRWGGSSAPILKR
jgi:hypothetical protein